MRQQPPTLLKQLCMERSLGVPEMVALFSTTAAQIIGKGSNDPTCSERTAKRWRAGNVDPLSLSSDTCRVLQAMFGQPVAELFGPPIQLDARTTAFDLEQKINMMAEDAHHDASATAAASISDTSLDQLTDDVAGLAHDYACLAPVTALQRGHALQARLQDQRDHTRVPAQQQRLLLLSGQTMALLAVAAFDLGAFAGARRLARTADLYAETARFEPLRAYADGILAYIAYFTSMPGEAVAKARRAQTYGGLGDVARRRLLAIEARALGHLGDRDAAMHALRLAEDVDDGTRDDLHDGVGGEFGFPADRLAMSNSSTALLVHDANQAEISALQALQLIDQQPAQTRSAHVLGGASADLGMARLLSDDVEGAAEALLPLWNIPADQRVTGVLARTSQIQHLLTSPAFRGAVQPAQLRQQIEDFTRAASAHQLTGSALLQLEG